MPTTPTRALIFANGEQIEMEAVRALIRPDDYLISADGGLRHLHALGVDPALLIGDLDSVDPQDVDALAARGVRIERHSIHKNETDLELAVEAALQAGCTTLLIVGALGGRLDMTLGNIFLLSLPVLDEVDARLEDGIDEVFLIRGGRPERQIFGQPGDRVSLLPLGGPAHGVVTRNMMYPLRSETLYPDRTRGISNLMTETRGGATLESGTLICIHTRLPTAANTLLGEEKK